MFGRLGLAALFLACACPSTRAQERPADGGNPPTLEWLVSQEKRAPTTAKNVRERHKALGEFAASTGDGERYLPFRTHEQITQFLRRGQGQQAAELVHPLILKLEKGGDAGGRGPSGAASPGPGGAPTLEQLISEEERAPTTAKNVYQRYEALGEFAGKSPTPERYLTLKEALRISGLLVQGQSQQAASLVHAAILNLKKAGETAGREPPGTASPDAAGSAGAQALARLIQEEKNTPTTEDNVHERNQALLDALISTGQKHYLPRPEGDAILELLRQERRAEAASKLHAFILGLERLLPAHDAAPVKAAGADPGQAPVPADSDKTGAAALYFKAMQDYARGKVAHAASLLESAAKLDPDSRDIAKALERLRKER